MAGNSTDPGRSVTSKVTAILMVFADGDVHSLTEIAAYADLPTSTAHRLASELVAWRLLERTEERQLSDRFAVTNDCQRVLGVRSLLNHPDRDAGAAGAARTVKGDPPRGAAGHSARLR